MTASGESIVAGLHAGSASGPDGLVLALPGSGGKPTLTKSHRGSISWLLGGQLAFGLLMAIATGMLVLQTRQQALTAAGHEMQSLGLTLADQGERAFDAIDLLQISFIEMTRAENIQTPEEFRRRMASPEINQQLIINAGMLPQLDTIGIVDANGTFINYNHALPVPAINIADRPYFAALKADPSLTRIISDPIVTRVNNSWAVVLGHRIRTRMAVSLASALAGS